uniref:Uncharacterized protein n=1 Tax=Rangifer tarandus platyrhynchus TaxID=3082113 RepID=A0ACB0DZI2_RANTA|nr:unnamed protein product [Rangifer tarandus platyrhynchus]
MAGGNVDTGPFSEAAVIHTGPWRGDPRGAATPHPKEQLHGHREALRGHLHGGHGAEDADEQRRFPREPGVSEEDAMGLERPPQSGLSRSFGDFGRPQTDPESKQPPREETCSPRRARGVHGGRGKQTQGEAEPVQVGSNVSCRAGNQTGTGGSWKPACGLSGGQWWGREDLGPSVTPGPPGNLSHCLPLEPKAMRRRRLYEQLKRWGPAAGRPGHRRARHGSSWGTPPPEKLKGDSGLG